MSLKPGVNGIECLQFLDWIVPTQCEHGVKRYRGVPLTQDQTVALRHIRSIGIDVQSIEVEVNEDVGYRKWTTYMAGSGSKYRAQDQLACPR